MVFLELGVGFNLEFIGCENVFLNGIVFGFMCVEVVECFD